MTNDYSYEDVKDAYKAIIEVGKARAINVFGMFSAEIRHRKNLKILNESAKELYVRLLNDKSINY